jgi:Ser/Thr protein kinase RdoA (MazF antagonist)
MADPIPLAQVQRSLEPFGLTGARVQLLSDVDCIVYRITASGIDGQSSERQAVLKVYPAHKKEAAHIQAEVDWLQALSLDTDLRVPRPLRARDGSMIQAVGTGAAGEWPAVLYTWVDGRSMDQELVPDSLRRIGRFVGRLHRHSLSWEGAARQTLRRQSFTQRVLGWVLGMERPQTLSPEAWNVIDRAARRLESEIAAVGQDAGIYGFIHSDLYLSNCLFHEDSVGVIDFSDCALGHYADDVASALVFLRHPWVGNFDHGSQYPRLRDAFFEGYEAVHALPPRIEAMLETYFAARILLLFAYVHEARDHVAWVPECLIRCETYLKDYLEQPPR